MTKKPDGRIPIRCTGIDICYFATDDILLCEFVWTVSVRPSVSKILSSVVRFGEDFLTKKRVMNHGEVPQYYVEGHHEPIISPKTFDEAQAELTKREGSGMVDSVTVHKDGSVTFQFKGGTKVDVG